MFFASDARILVHHSHRGSYFLETASGHTQWEVPGYDPEGGLGQQPQQPFNPAQDHAAPLAHTKRRQYAAGQTQAYYGGAPDQPAQYVEPSAPTGQLFTPGLTADAQPQYFAPEANQGYASGGQPPYTQAQPPYLQQQQQPVNDLGGQFSQLGLGQKPVSITWILNHI